MNVARVPLISVWLIFALSGSGLAHFGMLIPSDSMVMQTDDRKLRISMSFSHPFEMVGMKMVKPKRFSVSVGGKTVDLMETLQPVKIMGHQAWTADYTVKRPGVLLFFMEPEPYWEPAEDAFIIHHTKTVVAAFVDDEGWDAELGLKTEIVPLSRPFGLYAGNLFQGVVELGGSAVPNAAVEVAYYNSENGHTAPTEYMITQTVKTDGNGVFTYATPFGGWWGFAALNAADFNLPHEGEDKDVELGAVMWVYFHPIREGSE
jgi:cobalt/nickel transport protein